MHHDRADARADPVNHDAEKRGEHDRRHELRRRNEPYNECRLAELPGLPAQRKPLDPDAHDREHIAVQVDTETRAVEGGAAIVGHGCCGAAPKNMGRSNCRRRGSAYDEPTANAAADFCRMPVAGSGSRSNHKARGAAIDANQRAVCSQGPADYPGFRRM